jgi:hypothetical protein
MDTVFDPPTFTAARTARASYARATMRPAPLSAR